MGKIYAGLIRELRCYGAIRYVTATEQKPRSKPLEYSPKKPCNCPVKAEFCFDCTEPDCTYDRM